MVRAPLLMKTIAAPALYRGALVFIAIGLSPLLLLAFGIADFTRNGVVVAAVVCCILYGLWLAVNTFLQYPRLRLVGERLTIEASPFTVKVHELDGLGPAYFSLYDSARGRHAVLLFRDTETEQLHRAAEEQPHEPDRADAIMEIAVDRFVSFDVDKGEALAKAINAHRGL